MPHDNKMDLALYRMNRAEETLEAAKRELLAEDYRTDNNRAYYAVFHAIRALLALDGADYKKHSGVLAHFNQYYIKTGIFPVEFSEIVGNASEIRNDSDYDDFLHLLQGADSDAGGVGQGRCGGYSAIS